MNKKEKSVMIIVVSIFIIVLAAGYVYEHFGSILGEANNYPLLVDNGGSGTVTYYYNRPGNQYCLAIMYIANESKQRLTIDAINLMDSENIEVLEVALIKIIKGEGLPGFQHWPVADDKKPFYFDQRIQANGAVIEPGEGYNLMFVVKLVAEEGHAAGQEVIYHDSGGKRYKEKSYYGYAFNNDGMPTIQETQQLTTQ